MKLTFKKLILFILVFISITLLVSCDEDADVCEKHSDSDGDGICDACGVETEDVRHPCESCYDGDGDGKCDACGADCGKDVPCNHNDENNDGLCDSCSESLTDSLPLISNGKTSFSFVLASGLSSSSMMAVDKLVSEMKRLGVEVKTLADKPATITEYEVLFGEVTSRGEAYRVDPHIFGTKGYTIRIIGKKIVVLGGSKEALVEAISAFRSEFLEIDETKERLVDRLVNPSQNINVVQSDYKINKLTLFGEDIRGYSISIDKKNYDVTAVAERLQTLFYETCGYWFPIADTADASEKLIEIKLLEKTENEGFYITYHEGKIEISSEYVTSLRDVSYRYFSEKLDSGAGTLNFDSKDNFTKDVRYVCYKDFGAVGDGVTNDADAILAAHRYAYEGGHKKVIAESGKTYYIGEMSKPALVTCDVDWKDAKFIIDDSVIKPGAATDIFILESSFMTETLSPSTSEVIKAINENGGIDAAIVKKLDLGLGYPAILKVNNSAHKNYIRYGSNSNSGEMQTEMILVDENGNIDPSTPFIFDYEKITSIVVYRIQPDRVTIEGGNFTTVANKAKSSSYYSRGIGITRSNVTVKNVKRYITGEGDVGAPYSHFLSISYNCDILIEDCVFSGHKTYYNSKGVGIGTYDINVDKAINVTFKNCSETTFFNGDGSLVYEKWGVMASGQAKNITYDGCSLTRFDAHQGIWNAKIKDSVIKDIRVVGGGTLEIENCHIYKNLVVSLREDYGAFWHGDVIIKNVTVHSDGAVTLFGGSWYNHDFGYPTAMPENITVDGLKIIGDGATVNVFDCSFVKKLDRSVLDEFTSTDSATGETIVKPNVNKTLPTKTLTVKNIDLGLKVVFPQESPFFENTVVFSEQ